MYIPGMKGEYVMGKSKIKSRRTSSFYRGRWFVPEDGGGLLKEEALKKALVILSLPLHQVMKEKPFVKAFQESTVLKEWGHNHNRLIGYARTNFIIEEILRAYGLSSREACVISSLHSGYCSKVYKYGYLSGKNQEYGWQCSNHIS